MAGISADKVKQVYFLLVLTVLGGLLGYMLQDFISSFLGAVTIYILLRSPLYHLTEKLKWPKGLTVTLLMLLSLVMLIMPLGLISIMLSSKAQYLVKHYADFLLILKNWNWILSVRFNINLLSNDSITKMTEAGANIIPVVLSATMNSLAQVTVLYFLLYFMMMDGRIIEKWVIDNAPFNKANTGTLVHELKIQTMSNGIGIPLLVIIQIIISAFGYWIFGMDEPLFWGVITGVASMIPIIGAAVIWLPVAIYMYVTGAHGHGIAIAIYCALLLVNVEHLVRFSLLKKIGNTHPLVTFFGIMIGLSLFGFLGLIFGPLLISYFLLLVRIYRKEYQAESEVYQD